MIRTVPWLRKPANVLSKLTGLVEIRCGAAVAAASAGDTLEIGSGSYKGALVIDRSLTLTGRDTGAGMPVEMPIIWPL